MLPIVSFEVQINSIENMRQFNSVGINHNQKIARLLIVSDSYQRHQRCLFTICCLLLVLKYKSIPSQIHNSIQISWNQIHSEDRSPILRHTEKRPIRPRPTATMGRSLLLGLNPSSFSSHRKLRL